MMGERKRKFRMLDRNTSIFRRKFLYDVRIIMSDGPILSEHNRSRCLLRDGRLDFVSHKNERGKTDDNSPQARILSRLE